MNSQAESRTQSILAILAELSARRVTGTLRFETAPGSELCHQFLFRKGKLLFATSNHPGGRLGEFLVRHGVLTEEESSVAITNAKQQGRFFHEHLIEEGLVSPETLPDLLYQRLEELVDEILSAKDGRFLFRPDLPAKSDEDSPPWVDQELFGRLLLHRNAWPKIFQRLRDGRTVLRCHPGIKGSVAFQSLSTPERKLLSLLDGTHTVSEILARRKNRIDLMIVLSRFLESGLIEVVQPPEGKHEVPSTISETEEAAGDPAARVILVDEGSEGPEILFVERAKPAEAPPAIGSPVAAATEAPVDARRAPEEGLLDETVELLERLEGPLLDKAADLLEGVEAGYRPDDEPMPDDTEALFREVGELIDRVEGDGFEAVDAELDEEQSVDLEYDERSTSIFDDLGDDDRGAHSSETFGDEDVLSSETVDNAASAIDDAELDDDRTFGEQHAAAGVGSDDEELGILGSLEDGMSLKIGGPPRSDFRVERMPAADDFELNLSALDEPEDREDEKPAAMPVAPVVEAKTDREEDRFDLDFGVLDVVDSAAEPEPTTSPEPIVEDPREEAIESIAPATGQPEAFELDLGSLDELEPATDRLDPEVSAWQAPVEPRARPSHEEVFELDLAEIHDTVPDVVAEPASGEGPASIDSDPAPELMPQQEEPQDIELDFTLSAVSHEVEPEQQAVPVESTPATLESEAPPAADTQESKQAIEDEIALSVFDEEPEPDAPTAVPVIVHIAPPKPKRRLPPATSDALDDAPLDLDLIPTLMPGVRLAELSLTGLLMDDLFLVSQIDGKSSIRELLQITQMPEIKARKVVRRLLDGNYIALESRTSMHLRPVMITEAQPKTPDGEVRTKRAAKSESAGSATARRTPAEQASDLYRRAIGNYNQDNFARSEELLRACLSLVPRHALYHARLAIVLLDRAGRDQEAEELAQKAVEIDPLMGQGFEAKGLVKLKLGQLGESRRMLEKAMVLDKKKVPSSVAILAAMKTYKAKKGEALDRLWHLVRPFVKLTP